MEEEFDVQTQIDPFVNLSVEDREDQLILLSDKMKRYGRGDMSNFELSSIRNSIPGLNNEQFQSAITWGNTYNRGRYEKGDELNSMFPDLFPELEGVQFPKYDINAGTVNVVDQNLNPENAQSKWQKITNAIDEGTNMYNNQQSDGVITNPGLLPEGSDEDIKKNLIQYGQVMKVTNPEFVDKYYNQRSGQEGDPFENPEAAYQFVNQAKNFQGTKFKVNALRYVAKNYDKNLYNYIEKNQDFFTYMPELRDDAEFMKMYNHHQDISSKYSAHIKKYYPEIYENEVRDIQQTLRLSGAAPNGGVPMNNPYIGSSVMVGLGGLVEGLGNLVGGVVEVAGKARNLKYDMAKLFVDDTGDEALDKIKKSMNSKVEETADNLSFIFSSDNWKDTSIGQFAYVPDQVAAADLSENPAFILPMTLKTVGEMAPALVASAYTGGMAAPVVMGGDQFFKSYHQTNKEARELGVDYEDREALSLSIAAFTGVTSGIFNNPLARKGIRSAMGIQRNATKQAVNTLASTGSRGAAIKSGTKAYFKEVFSEEIEELSQGQFENYQKYRLDQRSPEPIYGVDKTMSATEFTNTLILTATATTLMASPNLAVSQTQLEKEAWVTSGLDYTKFESLVKSELNKKNPKFNEQTANGMLEKAKEYQGIVNELKAEGVPMNQMVKQADLIYNQRKNVVNEETATEEAVQEKTEDIKQNIPNNGAIVDGTRVVEMIETIGDSKTDEELSSKLDNIQGRTFKMKRVSLETLYENNKDFKDFVDNNPDLEFDGRNKNKPVVIDENGNVLDGMKRLAAAYNRGQKQIRVFNEQETTVSENVKNDFVNELDELLTPKSEEVNENMEDIVKLGDHFQRVFKGSTISYDQAEFDAIAEAAGEDPNITKGLRNRTNNQIYINPRNATLDTPIHEFTHIWEDMLLEENPDAHKKALKLIKGTKFHKDAIAKGYGDRALREALVQAIGEKGAQIFKDPKRQSQFEQIIEEVKNIIKKALNLDPEFDFDIKTNSLQDVIQSSAEKIMGAKNIQSPKSPNPTKPQGMDMQVFDLQRYRVAERDAVQEFEALKSQLKNDPTLSDIKPVMKDGKYQFIKTKSGKLKVKISGQSYALVNGINEYYEGSIEEKIDQIGDKIVEEYNANQSVPEVVKGIGWYKDLHLKMRNLFGGRTYFFGKLLGASSGQTDVPTNYKYALEALKGYSKGAYDSYIEEYKDFIDRVEQYENEEELNQFFNEWKGRTINALKNDGQSTYEISRVNPDPKEINETKRKLLNLWPKANPLYRTDNPTKKYGINSPAVAKVLAGIWLKQTQQSKTNNFYRNVVGLTTNPTIDLWAARTIRRMIYDGNIPNYRIPERAEQGVDERVYAEQAGGLSDYQLAEAVIINASEKLGMDPDDLQAYLWFAEKDLWKKSGWSKGTAAQKGDFRQEADKNNIVRYYLGLSTERDTYNDPVLESKENIEILEEEKTSIENDLRQEELVSLKINTTQGQYLSYPERSFDAEVLVQEGQDITPILKRTIESAKKHEQEAVFISEVLPIDERMDDITFEREMLKRPNARPAVEIQFKRTMSFDEASAFAKENLDIEGVQLGPVKTDISGYTFITDESGSRVIGVKYQFVPEFIFENEQDITEENLFQASADWNNYARQTKENLVNNENILYFYNHYVDTFVAHNNQYNNILNEINNGSTDIFKGSTKVRTREYFESKARTIERGQRDPNFDAQKSEDGNIRPRFSGTIQANDGGSISAVEHRRIDTQKLPDQLTSYLSKLQEKGYLPSQLIPAIKIYSEKVNSQELSTEQARMLLNKFMAQQGMRQRGFETGSITKAQDQDEATKVVYDWINENPNYYKTMNMKETMEIVVEEINNMGGFENSVVVESLLRQNPTIEELPRVQLARQAALHHHANKISKLRSEGASDSEIDAAIKIMSDIERALANDATLSGQASAALRSWTAQTPQSIIDRIELAMEQHNDNVDNASKFGNFLNKLFGGKGKLESTTLTEEQRRKVTEFHDILKTVPENSELANVTMRSAYKYMDSLVPSYTWQDTFFGLQYAALLSGMSTQILNVMSGSANIVLQPLMEMSRVDKIFTGGYLDFIRKVGKGTMSKGMEQGRALAMDILTNGARVDKYTDMIEGSQRSDIGAGKYNVLESTEFKGGKKNIYNYYKYVGRLLNATDRFIGKVGYEGRYYNYLVDKLRKDGIPEKDIHQKASDLYLATKVSNEAKQEMQNILSRLQELDPNTDFSNIETVRMRELMHEALVQRYMKDYQDKTDSELKVIQEKEYPEFEGSIEEFKDYLAAIKEMEINGISLDANLASNAQVFIDKRQGAAHPVASVANFIRQFSNSESRAFGTKLALKSFVPFTSIIGSIGEYMIDTTPGIGLARAYMAEEGLGKKGTRMRDEQLSRAYFGTMSFLALAAIALVDDEDDPVFRVSGGGFNNPNQYTRNDMKNAELPPYSIQIKKPSGEYMTMDYRNIIPLAIPLALIGNYSETFKSTGGEGEVFDNFMSRFWVMASNSAFLLSDSSVLTSTRELLEAISGAFGTGMGSQFDKNMVTDQDIEKSVNRLSTTTIRSIGGTIGRVMPQNLNLFRQVVKIMDPTSYSAGDAKNALLYAAGLSQIAGQPRIDVFGEPAKSFPGETVIPYTHWLNIRGEDPLWQFIDKYNAYPSRVQNRPMRIGSMMRELTDDELYNHTITTGKEFKRLLTNYVNGRGKQLDRVTVKRGQSASMHRDNIKKLWRSAQNKSKLINRRSWIQNNKNL